jgi:hypothetical protein
MDLYNFTFIQFLTLNKGKKIIDPFGLKIKIFGGIIYNRNVFW